MGPAIFVAVALAAAGAIWIARFMPAHHIGEQEQMVANITTPDDVTIS